MIMDPSELAREARIQILTMTSKANASHVGSALSVVDILSTLYTSVVKFEPLGNYLNENLVILSKGHAASALYAVLALQGHIPFEWLAEFCSNGAQIGGHVTSTKDKSVALSTGSLGHGLPYGVGIALANKLDEKAGRCFVVMSDGECDEGTTWESALLANHHKLNNLCVIVDRNNLQSLKSTEETLKLEPFKNKWKSFGWDVRSVDGHNHNAINKAIKQTTKPLIVIANTLKGNGISFMENSILWHYKPPDSDELARAISELSAS
jgi:transketolase